MTAAPAFPLTDKQAVFLQRRAVMLNAMLDRLEASNRELAALGIAVAPVATDSVSIALMKSLTALWLSGHQGDENFYSLAAKVGLLPSRVETVLAVAA